MLTSVSAGVGDLPCFPTFFYDSKWNLKFLIYFPYTCLLFSNILMTGESTHKK